jgi:hypothetical protein
MSAMKLSSACLRATPVLALVVGLAGLPQPAAAAKCVDKVWQNLEACGWPGRRNTGKRKHVRLKSTSSRVITKDNTVIKGERIGPDGLTIAAKNVVVKDSVITKMSGPSGSGVIEIAPGASAKLVRNRLNGNNATHAGIWYQGTRLVARRNNIFGINDGIFIWDADTFTIKDNYLHDFTENAANGHVDGFQTTGASHGIIRHNTFDVTQGQTSAIAIWNERRDSSDILVDNNLLAGGGFTIYAEDYSPSEENPSGGYSVTNIRIQNNKFSKVHYPCVGYWGVWYPRGAPTDGWNRSGNTVLETGQNIDNQNPPKPGGTLCN